MKSKSLAWIYPILTFTVILLMFPKYSYNDPDTFWHIELGKYMIDNGTVLHHAIHTFYGDKLPYVPHELGFQVIIALVYMSFGWPGIYVLTAVCLFMLMLGLDRLTRVSRKEMGLEERRSVLLLLILAVTCCIYYYYFTSRPQMISSFLIVWFFVYLREFRMQPSIKYGALMVNISLLIANIHAGVWPVIAVFTGMAIIEFIIEKKITKRSLITFGLVYSVGVLNAGGIKSLLYILMVTQNNFNMRIDEWQPIEFSSFINLPRLMLLLFFVSILPFVLHRKPFRFMFMLGIFYLGVANYKQNLFMWLFIPYFAATVVDVIPYVKKVKIKFNKRQILISAVLAISVNILTAFVSPTPIDKEQYPEDEMTYILNQTPIGTRPKVLALYGSSGYVMYRGGNILCDGRQDPFITDDSKGIFGWTAFERSMNGFSDYLPDIVKYDQPNYVITKNTASGKQLQDWTEKLGKPVFSGPYGHVFLINPNQ